MTDRELFIAALQIVSEEERAVWLQQACGTDETQRQRIAKLLQRHAESESLLNPEEVEHTAAFVMHANRRDPPALEQAGDQIGLFKLLNKLGDGGMGTVWVAEQEKPIKRRVALKLVKAGMDSAEVLRRFEAERQALAMMDHTNIAKVFDAGTTGISGHEEPHTNMRGSEYRGSGRPYFVMELIKGVPITKYCDEVHASIRDRLDLFIQVCSAVQHAHQKGIIHRDIKPSNVLVAMQDGKPVPKVIDFGVAKALHTKLADQTMYTQIGQVVGTLEYMAPEQAELSAMDIDTRADIYALGILLYELLTGSTPITRQRMQEAALVEILRIIKEEEPPKPSTRLSESKENLASLASLRRTDPKHLSSELRGELDWVVLKALEKDRSRRYETANGLSRDLQRYLANETVEARPPSAGYRLRKFIKRNRGAVIAASLIFLTLLAGFIVSSYGFYLVEIQRRQKEDAEKHANEQWRRAEENAKDARKHEHEARQQEAQTLADFRASTDEAIEYLIGSKSELGVQERTYLEKTLQRWKEYADRKGDDEHSQAIRAEGHFRMAHLWNRLGRVSESEKEYRSALVIRQQLHSDYPGNLSYLKSLFTTQYNLGNALQEMGRFEEALTHDLAALSHCERLVRLEPNNAIYQQDLAHIQIGLGLNYKSLGRREEAKSQYLAARKLLNTLVDLYPESDSFQNDLAQLHNNLGGLYGEMGNQKECLAESHASHALRKKLSEKHPSIPGFKHKLGTSHYNLGTQLVGMGRWQEAIVEFEKSQELLSQLTAEYPSKLFYQHEISRCQINLGTALKVISKRTEAEQYFLKALANLEKITAESPNIPLWRNDLAVSYTNLANLYYDRGQLDKAEEFYRKAIKISEALVAAHLRRNDYRQSLALYQENLAAILKNENADAESLYRQALVHRQTIVKDNPNKPEYRNDLASSTLKLGAFLEKQSKFPEAEEILMQALTMTEKLSREHPNVAEYAFSVAISHFQLSFLMKKQNRYRESQTHCERGVARMEKLVAVQPSIFNYRDWQARGYMHQALLMKADKQTAASIEWYDKGIGVLEPLLVRQPRHANVRLALWSTYGNKALAHDQLKQYPQALQAWNRMLEICPPNEKTRARILRATTLLRTGDAEAAISEVNEVTAKEKLNADQWYDVACAYSLASTQVKSKQQEYADRGMEMLNKAVKAGFNNVEHLSTDTDIDALRQRNDFKKLMETLKQPVQTKQ